MFILGSGLCPVWNYRSPLLLSDFRLLCGLGPCPLRRRRVSKNLLSLSFGLLIVRDSRIPLSYKGYEGSHSVVEFLYRVFLVSFCSPFPSVVESSCRGHRRVCIDLSKHDSCGLQIPTRRYRTAARHPRNGRPESQNLDSPLDLHPPIDMRCLPP